TKVLIELNCLTEEEADKACEIVVSSGADFLKTGTGWVPGDANIERIRRIKKNLAGTGMKVKAAGGIRTREEFDELLEMGVERFGINTQSAIEIVKSFE
ncbi:HisA/HisF-related TIM barrel protein, partial [Christensenella minuta]